MAQKYGKRGALPAESPIPAPANARQYPICYSCAWIAGAVAFFLYANTVVNNYALDDLTAVQRNQYVHQGVLGIPMLLTQDFWQGSGHRLGYYRPLAPVSLAIEHQLFKGNPHISHLMNALLYGMAAVALFLVLSRCFPLSHPSLALCICLLFAAHPIHTEIVANIKGRDELLSFANVLAAAWFFFLYLDRKKTAFVSISLLLYYFALLSKETALLGAALIPLFLYYGRNMRLLPALTRAWPFALVAGVFLIQKAIVLSAAGVVVPDDIVNYPYRDANVRLPTALHIMLFGLRLLVVPHPLRYDYSYNQIPAAHWNDAGAVLGLIVLAAGAAIGIRQMIKRSIMGFGFIFLGITIVPALAFVILRGGIFAERLLFAPSLGYCVILATAVAHIIKMAFKGRNESQKMRLVRAAVFVLIIAAVGGVYAGKTIHRNTQWKDNVTLFSADIGTGVNSAQNQRHLGEELLFIASNEKDPQKRQQLTARAEKALRQAVRIHPGFGEAYGRIALMYHTVTLNIDSAIYYYRKSTDVSPSFAMGYYNLGVIYQSLGENNKASYLYNQALKYDPEYHEAKDAAAALKAATGLDIQVDPFSSQIDTSRAAANSGGYFDRGNYFASRGEYAKAASAFFRAYELDPNNTSAAINLSNCYGMLHRYPDALAAAQKVLERNPNDAAALENIAVTYKLMGKADLAKQYWEQAKKARKR